ncbi:SDR family NAD(P)-dependent oxidoreductase [uncultured Limnohabitans sp.]|uniref:SDR family NAD(P)-dependent oxidoreductase n=1 Tax=uncultured Limnohabitans sp. TaxID=768543 RepID=UPI001B773504|nr:SDR family NAD(P)-dependent oxidoreductase [uncultured Limnohabitans sp.]MBP6221629.1 SDR family NAD(P)-dependent oxidoreductase [Limnohabitans sp.]MBP6245876.1 SDR family NAD(P)-dependent oxidoreductase [Limnohabitans sp.]
MYSLPEGYRALVIGASGAIGSALLQRLQSDSRCAAVLGVSRQSTPGLDLLSEASIAACAQALAAQGPFHLVLDATGALTLNGRGPEKRLDELDAAHLLAALQLNAVGPGLLLKHFVPLLASGERVIWGKLSARVGSIEDNRKGGWYGYRAAKAALNMLLQTAAIEVARRKPLAVVAALQPGTVQSALSQPFVGDDALRPDDSAGRLLSVLDALQPTGRAQFVDHQGQHIPW